MTRKWTRALLVLAFALRGAAYGADAESILKAAGVQGGLVVHLGCGDGALTAALRVSDSFLVHGLDRDAARVAEARERIHTLGLYGKVSAAAFDGERLPYIDNLVNLVVASGKWQVTSEEIARVLAPRGVLLAEDGSLDTRHLTLDTRPLTQPTGWVKAVKPWPKDMDEWTHWLHGPDSNAVSRDRGVGISRSLQWVTGPLWSRQHNLLPSVSAMVSASGRLFTIIDEGPIATRGVPDRWSLNARDAFNGLLLWKRPMRNWGWRAWSEVEVAGHMRFKGPSQLARRLVAVGDVVYVTLGFDQPVVALDAATGKTLRQYGGTAHASEILVHNGLLVLARNTLGDKPGKDILAIDAKTGALLWEKKGHQGITAHNDELSRYTDAYLTVGGGKAFFLDGDHIVALDLKSGAEAWRAARPAVEKGVIGHYKFDHANLCTLVYSDGRIFLGQMSPFADNLNKRQEKAMVVLALDAASGTTLWEHNGATFAHFTPPDLFVTRGLVWTFQRKEAALIGLDVRSGEVRKTYPAKSILVGHHARCYRNKATERFYLAGEEGIEYIDFESGEIDVHHWLRGACRYGILPANGLIYLPTHSCGCHNNAKLNGFLAVNSKSEVGGWPSPPHRREGTKSEVQAKSRLERGPAYGASLDLRHGTLDTSADWPVYRHDAQRSGSASTAVPAALSKHWTRAIGGRLTAPVVAGGAVFVASPESHTVHCLDAATGEPRWRFIADGPVDTPPTWWDGRVVFGSRGGTVTSLAAADGRLVWRFQAAPEPVRLVAFGSLESPWPVHGSVLVVDGRVYCVAGRSMHLDSGLYAYVLDAKTGEPLQQARLEADAGPKGELEGTILPDILVSDGSDIYMRSMRLSPGDIRKHELARGGSALLANDGGLLDDTWFNSAFWRYGGAEAQMLVFDGKEVVGIQAYKKFVSKSYPHDIFTAGKGGYRLFASAVGPAPDKAGKRRGKTARPADKWAVSIPVRAQAMVLTGQHVCLAGAPDVVDEQDPWAALERRGGGVLAVFARSDGSKVAEHKLGAVPVYDGMAAAQRQLYLALADGTVQCWR